MNNGTQGRHESAAAMIPKMIASAGEKLEKAPEAARKEVRRYPLATAGIAFAAGIAVGIAGWVLFAPRPPTFRERIGDTKKLRKLLDRII